MFMLERLRQKAKSLKKRIVLPEAEDLRVREAKDLIDKEKIAEVILLEKNSLPWENKKRYAKVLFELRKEKGMQEKEAEMLLEDPLYYAAMMVYLREADGFVAGASHTTADVARAGIRCLGVDKEIGFAFSCFLMELKNQSFGQNGVFVFADCGIIPEPSAMQLAMIAVKTAEFAYKVLDIIPRVALLSYSTKGSSKVGSVEKVREAVVLAKKINPDLILDGELQVDAAIVPEVAKIKCPDSSLEGKANILIFPNLEAGNIGYKLVQRLADARAIGPILLGLNRPASDLSRGCSVEDIVDCVAVVSILSEKK
jgi:phosphate acetyltransferase